MGRLRSPFAGAAGSPEGYSSHGTQDSGPGSLLTGHGFETMGIATTSKIRFPCGL